MLYRTDAILFVNCCLMVEFSYLLVQWNFTFLLDETHSAKMTWCCLRFWWQCSWREGGAAGVRSSCLRSSKCGLQLLPSVLNFMAQRGYSECTLWSQGVFMFSKFWGLFYNHDCTKILSGLADLFTWLQRKLTSMKYSWNKKCSLWYSAMLMPLGGWSHVSPSPEQYVLL